MSPLLWIEIAECGDGTPTIRKVARIAVDIANRGRPAIEGAGGKGKAVPEVLLQVTITTIELAKLLQVEVIQLRRPKGE